MKKTKFEPVVVLGAGLAGTEATFQLIRRGIPVRLVEMRPSIQTGAHKSAECAELVCSNSFGSNFPDRASGLLKEELRTLSSHVLDVAYRYRVPAGQALAVDRHAFSREISRYIKGHSLVEFVNVEATSFPEEGMIILATGPLTSLALQDFLAKTFGNQQLFFFDAIAPIVSSESIDMSNTFKSDRYDEDGNGDYINCPLTQEEYERFVKDLVHAEQIPLSGLEKSARKTFFCACQPIEEIARSGLDSLRFGPMKPVGLIDPRTKKRPYAVLQLRQDNLLGSFYNLVGCQTNLIISEQERIFRMIPALKEGNFIRFGQMHRNCYLNSPKILLPTMQTKNNLSWFVGGQISGVEGYTESIGTGLLAGLNAARITLQKPPVVPPAETMLGALVQYITFAGHKKFMPMSSNFGLFQSEMPEISGNSRKEKLISHARKMFREFANQL